MKKLLWLAVSAAMVLVLVGGACGQLDQQETAVPEAGAPLEAEVTIQGTGFVPVNVLLRPGGKVTWTNAATTRFSVTLAGGFDEVLDPGESFTFTFGREGHFDVYDRLNNQARMKVVVEAAP